MNVRQVVINTAFIFLLGTQSGFSQEVPKKLPRFDLRAGCMIPRTMSNKAFQDVFDGVFHVNLSGNIRLYKGLYIGLIGEYSFFEINRITGVNTNMKILSGGGQLGYDIPLSDKVIWSVAASGGQSYTQFTSVRYSSQPSLSGYKYSSTYAAGHTNLYFKVETNFFIGANLSFIMHERSFDPGFIHLTGFKAESLEGITGYLNFGFGFYYGFVKKKKEA